MNNFKNLKIAITDETHLKAVCDVLESMGYSEGLSVSFDNNYEYKWVGSNYNGVFGYYTHKDPCIRYDVATLSDLLKMRDDMVKANAKSR